MCKTCERWQERVKKLEDGQGQPDLLRTMRELALSHVQDWHHPTPVVQWRNGAVWLRVVDEDAEARRGR